MPLNNDDFVQKPLSQYNDIPLPGLQPEPITGFRSKTVVKIVGVTYRQIDHWTSKGMVEASIRGAEGSGTKRLYSFQDIVKFKLIKRLLDTGITLQKIEKALTVIEERSWHDVEVIGDSSGNIYAVEGPDEVFDLLKEGQGVFMVSIDPIWNEAETQVASLMNERVTVVPGEDEEEDELDEVVSKRRKEQHILRDGTY